MMNDNFKHSEITDKIIKAFYKVYNKMGYGFLEKVYENAMVIELRSMGLQVCQQMPINVYYNETKVGLYFSDLLVNDLIIVELKAAESLCEENEYQLINYLKSTKKEVGLLFNFGIEPEIKRKVFTNSYKKS